MPRSHAPSHVDNSMALDASVADEVEFAAANRRLDQKHFRSAYWLFLRAAERREATSSRIDAIPPHLKISTAASRDMSQNSVPTRR